MTLIMNYQDFCNMLQNVDFNNTTKNYINLCRDYLEKSSYAVNIHTPETPITAIIKYYRFDTVLLLKNLISVNLIKSDINNKNYYNKSPIEVANDLGRKDIIKIIIQCYYYKDAIFESKVQSYCFSKLHKLLLKYYYNKRTIIIPSTPEFSNITIITSTYVRNFVTTCGAVFTNKLFESVKTNYDKINEYIQNTTTTKFIIIDDSAYFNLNIIFEKYTYYLNMNGEYIIGYTK